MHAIQQVIREIKKLGGIENSQEARDLQQLVNGANDYLQCADLLDTQPVPRVNHKQQAIGRDKQRNKQNLTQSPPRVNQPSIQDKAPQHNGPPASRTRSKTAHIRIENAAATRQKG